MMQIIGLIALVPFAALAVGLVVADAVGRHRRERLRLQTYRQPGGWF